MKPEKVYGGQGSIKWKITKACFYAGGNEAEEGESVAGVTKNLNFEFQSSLEIKVERKTQFSLAYTQTLRTRATTGMILESM